MRRLKICLFHTEFAYSGGAERVVFGHLDYLNKVALAECFTSFIDGKNVYPEILAKYRIRQILPKLLNKFVSHEVMILLTAFFFPFFLPKFRNFDLFIGENQPGPFLAFIASTFFRKPYIVYINWPPQVVAPRNIDLEKGLYSDLKPVTKFFLKVFNPFIKTVDRLSIASANKILANGEYVETICKKIYKKPIISCPSGTKIPQKITSLGQRIKGSISIGNKIIKKPYVLITNRHFPKKRFEYGLHALKEVVDKGFDFRLIISGKNTAYTQGLRILAKKLEIEKKVYFLGFIKEEELKKLYANAFSYLYTAPEEDYGMGVIEATSYGVPVLAWNKAGPSRIITHGKTGFLAKPGDYKEFSSNLLKIIQLPKKEYNKICLNSYNLSKEKYSKTGETLWDAICLLYA